MKDALNMGSRRRCSADLQVGIGRDAGPAERGRRYEPETEKR